MNVTNAILLFIWASVVTSPLLTFAIGAVGFFVLVGAAFNHINDHVNPKW